MKALIKLELCNLFGLNVFRFSRDKKARRKSALLLVLWIALLALMFFYVGGLAYGLLFLGLGQIIPAYLTVLSSLLIFVFGILKAGGAIFRREGYDILCALPVSKNAVVAARLIRMYVENLLMTVAVMLPGLLVYAWNVRPHLKFYLAAVLWALSVPVIPMVGSVLIGTLVTGVTCRMRHKSVVAAGLSILAVFAIFYGCSRISALEDSFNPAILKELSVFILGLLEKIYPPAVWGGAAVVDGNLLICLLWLFVSLAVFLAAAMGVSLCFHGICRRLFSSRARHDYEMKELKEQSVLISLCRREFQRYFSSTVYVTNTILGPIMGCVLSATLLAVGRKRLERILPFPVDVGEFLPFALAGGFCMMTVTATSISMEGKNWWILKSLPLTAKSILDAKILMNLLLFLPFYILSELFTFLALRPGIVGFIWLLLIPAELILFSCVYGIVVNLHFPVLEWENEVSVVKQSVSAMLGGMGGFILAILGAVGLWMVPTGYEDIYKGLLCLAIFLVTAFLYRKDIGG